MKQRSQIEIAAIEWAKARVNFRNYELDRSSLARLLALCIPEIAEESKAVEPTPEQLGIEAKA